MINQENIMMHTPIVIGLVGFKESGKTYFGKYLEKNYTFKRLSFAQGIQAGFFILKRLRLGFKPFKNFEFKT